MSASYDVIAMQRIVKGYGLDDPELVETLRFKDVREMFEAIFPGLLHACRNPTRS
jgi:hypothetical protein